MKKNGFTLIELLAVIIILAVIALIAVPVVLNVVESAKKSAFESTAYGIVDAMKLKSMENRLNQISVANEYTFPSSEISVQGVQPTGIGKVDEEGRIAIALNNGKWCALKGYKDGFVRIKEYTEGECELPGDSAKPPYKDESGANIPDLLDNMIPVKYENGSWVYADITQKWYDYDAQEWANAVVLNSGVTKTVGDTIEESEIALWYVWIPRYTYTIFNAPVLCSSVSGLDKTYNAAYSTCYTGTTVGTFVPENYTYTGTAVQLIDVEFESGTGSNGTVSCSDVDFTTNPTSEESETCTDKKGSITKGVSTYTHPAFTFGDKKLTGFWVGKFEVSGSTDAITVKPNVDSLRSQKISSFFTAIQNMSTTYRLNGDSHMMKNMEWGAVAYLKQSEYGLGTTDIGINNYRITNEDGTYTYRTGCGASAGSGGSTTCNAYNTEIGMLASTTGNVYGVYDMSGGAFEYTMGTTAGKKGEFSSNTVGFPQETILDAKYYDAYAYDASSNTTHARGKLGDATKETLSTFGSITGGWASDFASFPYSGNAWFLRGGGYGHSNTAGVFYFFGDIGGINSIYSARAVLAR